MYQKFSPVIACLAESVKAEILGGGRGGFFIYWVDQLPFFVPCVPFVPCVRG